MCASNSSGGDDVYASACSDVDSGGDGRGSCPAGGKERGKIGAAGLGYIGGFGDQGDLIFGETYHELPVENRNGRRECAGCANSSFHLESRVEIVGAG